MKRCILVAFFSNSTNSEKAKAYLHCKLVRRALLSILSNDRGGGDVNEDEMNNLIQEVEITSERELVKLWPLFESSVTNAGWKLDKTECATEGYTMHLE